MRSARQLFLGRGAGGGGWQNPYVTDGLVAMFDGEWNAGPGVHDPNAMTWLDLAGGVVAQLTCGHGGSARNPNMRWGDDALVYPDSLSCAEFSMSSLGTATTIEVAFSSFARVSNYYATFDTFDDAVNLYKAAVSGNINSTIYGVHPIAFSGTGSVLWYEGDARTISFFFGSGSCGIQTGNIRNTQSVGTYNPSAKKWGIGGPYSTNFWTGKIHSFRIYSRVITEEEIRMNQGIDKERFNLP